MNYSVVYERFIKDRRALESFLIECGAYTERHHIVPRGCGGTNAKTNIVRLKPSDHYFAHILLARIYGGHMWLPLIRMARIAPLSRHSDLLVVHGGRVRMAFYTALRKHALHLSASRSGKVLPQFADYHETLRDRTAFEWHNKLTGEVFSGSTFDLANHTKLSRKHLVRLTRNRLPSYKGWKLLSAPTLRSGKVRSDFTIRVFINLRNGSRIECDRYAFADKHGFGLRDVASMISGRFESHHGWTVEGRILSENSKRWQRHRLT